MTALTALTLAGAIAFEVVATLALKATEGFTRPWPLVVVVAGYGIAFYLLSLTLMKMPLGMTYAIWSAAGTVLLTVVGAIAFGQRITPVTLTGIALAVLGIVMINASSDPIH